MIDTAKPTGALSKLNHQYSLEHLKSTLTSLNKNKEFQVRHQEYNNKSIQNINRIQFSSPYFATHCFRGYPIYGSFKQFNDTNSKFILHLDSDMLFYEQPDFSWIQEGVRILEKYDDVLCVLPRGGPPKKDNSLNQGTTNYEVDHERELYLFKNFTSRHYLIHRERFLSLLPMTPLWLSWREPIKNKLHGNGKMLCWESIVGNSLEKSPFWRADLMTEKAWSLHPGDRSKKFYDLLPKIIDCVNRNEFPVDQKGHFDIILEKWETFIQDASR